MYNLLEAPFRALAQIGPRLIMIAAMVTSYSTQLHLFRSWGVDPLTAYVAPAVIDLLVITCAEILHDPRVIRGKAWAGLVLVVAGAGSMAANWIAGASVGSKVVHAAMVLGVVLAELVVGAVKRRETVAVVETAAVQPAGTEVKASDAMAEDLPVAPVSPGPTGSTKRGRGPSGEPLPYKGAEDISDRHARRLKSGK